MSSGVARNSQEAIGDDERVNLGGDTYAKINK